MQQADKLQATDESDVDDVRREKEVSSCLMTGAASIRGREVDLMMGSEARRGCSKRIVYIDARHHETRSPG